MDAVLSRSSCEVTALYRAQIIQRVLVDGWSAAQAAAVFDLPERRIARWVADYRRRGMASLRDEDPGEGVFQRWLHSLTGALSRGYGGLRRGCGLVEPAPCIRLRYAEEAKPDHGRADLA
ncbi:MAG: helix-turn-helix domain-containing protein [Alphaproteobacteria bacterium]|nr:helix-turn-helix domain-containing protein [Alphaproteobacteria bacterium]MBV9150471.1 helix-turn-helix domain-containing protein [Alphaproteobacteria bacterium]MBV9966062.1 helix-turn-helix domain-containing protein [Alphaproteobacteria bacterium]